MSKIQAKNTKPEIIVRKFLFSKGFRFRIHQRNLPGKPDVVLKKHNAVILINGCFWHAHKNCKLSKVPRSRQSYWIPKLQGNIQKDRIVMKELKKSGWRVLVIWECEIRGNDKETALSALQKKLLTYSANR